MFTNPKPKYRNTFILHFYGFASVSGPEVDSQKHPDTSSEHFAKNVLLSPWWFYKLIRLGTISVPSGMSVAQSSSKQGHGKRAFRTLLVHRRCIKIYKFTCSLKRSPKQKHFYVLFYTCNFVSEYV